jgi:hypothetical protein
MKFSKILPLWHCPALQTHPCLCSLDMYKKYTPALHFCTGQVSTDMGASVRRGSEEFIEVDQTCKTITIKQDFKFEITINCLTRRCFSKMPALVLLSRPKSTQKQNRTF